VELKPQQQCRHNPPVLLFESNQSGIETRRRRRRRGCRFCLNRTRVELKRLLCIRRNVREFAFESNQSGIETCRCRRAVAVFFCLNRTRVELKPIKFCANVFFADCLNRTRVELKRCSILDYIAAVSVWIEPEWNWNYVSAIYVVENANGLNRTRVELKRKRRGLYIRGSISLNRTRVELKLFAFLFLPTVYCWFESNQSGIETLGRYIRGSTNPVWIEPEWNWNQCLVHTAILIFSFESNQSGIETFLL